jgi:hypothetical protein
MEKKRINKEMTLCSRASHNRSVYARHLLAQQFQEPAGGQNALYSQNLMRHFFEIFVKIIERK